MSYKTTSNIAPYYDDYDDQKNFLRILFNPGRAVQGRELTQAQTILQNQITKFGDHIFKDGSSVIGSKINVDTEKPFIELNVTLSDESTLVIDDSWLGLTLWTGPNLANATAKATVEAYDNTTKVIHLNYYGGQFQDGDVVVIPGTSATATVATSGTGFGTFAHVTEGIVYINDHFNVIPSQSIIVEPKNVSTTHKIGYDVIESVISNSEDASLNDPANGSYNFNAPGADRYHIAVTLTSYEDAETPADTFISIVELTDGLVTKKQQLVDYSAILDTFARRTFDESGNYSVEQFNIKVNDHATDDTKLSVIVDAGKAYVLGYEVETISPSVVNIDRSRTTASKINAIALTPFGPHTDIDYSTTTNVVGTLDVGQKEIVELMSDVDGVGTILGSGRVLSIQKGVTNELSVYISGLDKYESIFSSVRSIRSQNTPAIYMNLELYEEDGGIPRLYGKDTKPLIFSNKNQYLSALVTNQTTYDVTRNINVTTDGLGQATVNAGATEVFTSGSYIYSTINSSGAWNAGAGIQSGSGTNSIIIENLPISTNVDITYKVTKTNANWKTKTLTQAVFVATSDATGKIILPNVDAYDIVSAIKTTGSVNVTANVVLDSGQTDYIYDYGSVTGLEASTEHTITYFYFVHGGTGDYFAINSYTGNAATEALINPNTGIAYNDFYGYVPSYVSTLGIAYDLRNAFDFRRSVTELGSGTDTVIPSDTITTDYSYYVPRTDKIYVDQYGNFSSTTGVPELYANTPKDADNGMVIGTLYISPYTSFPEEVIIDLKDTRRYTMEDIGELERRLENVEYYSAMNLLEQNARDLRITDKNGFDKFKNGILVDKFSGHDVGDVYNVDYRCAIDPVTEELRPSFLIDNIDFTYKAVGSSEIAVHDNIVTKSYTTTEFINQPQASETINVNPYNVFVWEGSIKLTPAIDNWVSTSRVPDLLVNENDSNANWAAARAAAAAFGTQWGWWRTNWVGVSRTTFTRQNVERWGRRTTTSSSAVTITNTSRSQTRFGSKLVVLPRTTRKNLGDSVINTTVIPWIRSRAVAYTATRMKPNTTVLAYFDDIDVSASCTNLTTDDNGSMVGTFTIPVNTFRTGDRILRFTDDSTSNPSTSSQGTYSASGLRQTKRATILSITKPELVRQTVEQSRVVNSVSISSQLIPSSVRTTWSDPIAESFLIDKEGGVFLSDIDIWFKTKPSSGIPITLRIVENDNGYPSQVIVPYSEVTLNPAAVTENASTPTTATKFTFSDPVYLQDATEYSFMLISNSNEYEVYVGKIGENAIGTTNRIDKQPYNGVMFKSQNASTWTADQERDIMFKINRCVFDTITPSVYIANTIIDFAADKLVTTNMFNVDNITLDSTSLELAYQYSGGTLTNFENKEDVNLAVSKTIQGTDNAGNADQLHIQLTMATTKDNLSPIISVDSASSIIIATNLSADQVTSPNDGQLYKVGGIYLTRLTNLTNPSDDLKVLLDVNKPSTTDVAVYFKTGLYEPRYVPVTAGEEVAAFEEENIHFYYDTTASSVVSLETSAIVSQIDYVNDRYYLKSITDSSKLVDPAGLAGQTIFAVAINDITFLENWAGGTAYTVGQHVWSGGLLYENVANNTGTTPGTNDLIWVLVEHTDISGAIVVGAEQEWREMIAETVESANSLDFIETTYKPKEAIIDEFSSFSIKIELLTNDEVTFPVCKAMRAIAVF